MSRTATVTGRPAASAAVNTGDAAASAPMTSAPLTRARATIAVPDSSPPPPSGTMNVSSSGWSAIISSAAVPAPAITSESL